MKGLQIGSLKSTIQSTISSVSCQQGLVELQRMQQREAASASLEVAPDDSDDESDAKVDKQRAMDDWKDANPTGWGNSKLRPTA